MSFESVNNPCPCESGLEYPYCCGAPDRNGLNVIAQFDVAETSVGNLPEGIKQAIESIDKSPDLYPVKLNLIQNYVQFVRMSEYWYSESVFLDAGRILGTCAVNASPEWLLEKTQDINQQITPVIFHTAFCGSTLMSKALDAIYNCLPIREPDALSNLLVYMRSQASDIQKEIWFDRVFALLGRRYEDDQPAIIKTNDYANGLINDYIERRPGTPVLFMYTPLADFFVGCVKAENRKTWIRDRYRSIASVAPLKIPALSNIQINQQSIGEVAAVYWSYNIALYYEALKSEHGMLRSLDFNDMLKAPLEVIGACATWFSLDVREGVSINDEINWLLGVYSKDASYEYSPQKRNEDIQNLLALHSDELDIAESLARKLLGENYPLDGLPANLLQ